MTKVLLRLEDTPAGKIVEMSKLGEDTPAGTMVATDRVSLVKR